MTIRSSAPTGDRKAASGHHTSIAYRADLDGLRAIAILPVVLFHAQIGAFHGGYVGVDVFFVVSGFLITSLISSEIDAGRFSYLGFWERRARRLLPAIIVVTAFVCFAGYRVLMPQDLHALGQSVVGVSTFASNVYFWLTSGYFARPAQTVPLLHTWSLSVEEQYYLVFPAVLLILTAWSRGSGWPRGRRMLGIAIIGIASFAISAVQVNVAPDAGFYLLGSRAWELMLGASLALSQERPRPGRTAADVLLGIGIIAILAPVFLYDDTTPFPGIAALAPCAGTAAIIWAGRQPDGRLRWLLTNPPMVYVGKLSYALYLWHWPLLVFWAQWQGRSLASLPASNIAAIVAVSFACAWLSLNLVENPIRRRRWLASRRAIFAASAGGLAVLGVFGLVTHVADGLAYRVPPRVRMIADAYDWSRKQRQCGKASAEDARAGRLCTLGNASAGGDADFVLWGDSHAQALMPAVEAAADDLGLSGVFASRGSCPPVIGVRVENKPTARTCHLFNRAVAEYIARAGIDKVVLAGMWNAVYRRGDTRTVLAALDESSAALPSRRLFERQFRRTIAFLNDHGAHVYVVEEAPYPTAFMPSRLARQVWRGRDPAAAGLTLTQYRERNSAFAGLLNRIDDLDFERVSQTDALCAGGFCPALTNGRPNFKDSNHLTRRAALRLEDQFREALATG